MREGLYTITFIPSIWASWYSQHAPLLSPQSCSRQMASHFISSGMHTLIHRSQVQSEEQRRSGFTTSCPNPFSQYSACPNFVKTSPVGSPETLPAIYTFILLFFEG